MLDGSTRRPIPVITLATEQASVPDVFPETSMSAQRLDGLRSALAELADVPIATLEAHTAPEDIDHSVGIPLGSLSPLAQNLAQLASRIPNFSSTNGETLYRMVVPAKVAAQMGAGIVSPMASKAVTGGVHSALMGGSKIAGQATFVPVAGKAAAAGAAGGSAGTAGVAAAGAGALTVASPLVLMAVAVGISAHADRQRQQALEEITKLLTKIDANMLADEQHALDACQSSINKASAILLDKGELGAAIGIDAAAFAVDTAISRARSRVSKWEHAIESLDGDKVELAEVLRAFPTIDKPGGEFYVHLQLARTAIATKQQLLVLQALSQVQSDDSNPFERFTQILKTEQNDIDGLERRLRRVLMRLSTLELDRSHGIRDFAFSSADVDRLLHTGRRLRNLGEFADIPLRQPDIAISMTQKLDGSIVVYPAIAE